MASSKQQMSLTEIATAWNEYKSRRAMQVLRGGVWHTEVLDGKPRGRIDGTSAQVIALSKAMTFPEFLETVWQK
jgi:hypothetical protein